MLQQQSLPVKRVKSWQDVCSAHMHLVCLIMGKTCCCFISNMLYTAQMQTDLTLRVCTVFVTKNCSQTSVCVMTNVTTKLTAAVPHVTSTQVACTGKCVYPSSTSMPSHDAGSAESSCSVLMLYVYLVNLTDFSCLPTQHNATHIAPRLESDGRSSRTC